MFFIGLALLLSLPDHSLFDGLLRAHVHEGLVDYDAFARAPEFPQYLDGLAGAVPKDLPEDERLALWINAYNAYTVALVNAHHERRSVRNINKTFGFLKWKGPWSERMARVGGRTLSLDDIEQRIVRKEFHEPRIHFALVCAARGCPPLRSEAYVGSRLNEQLADQARQFLLESPQKNRVDVARRVVYLSPIFKWYGSDFGGNARAIGAYIARFFPDGPERRLLESGVFELELTEYDWALNAH